MISKILIVEDMPDQITYVGSILHAEGYQVLAATNGTAMWRLLERQTPDLILLDVQMGQESGLALCQALKTDDRYADIPIIFLTVSSEKEVISRSFDLGGSDYIRKPFIMEELLARIRTQLRLAEQRRELLASNKELTDFTTAVSHDLKAPFNVINMLIDMLRQELGTAAGESVTTIMDMITAKSTQARIMIERLLDFSRMCNVEPRQTAVDVRQLAEETFQDLLQLEPNRTVEFHCEPLPEIFADRELTRMALKNLLQNALKYSRKRDKAVISVTAVPDPDSYAIRVTDNGVGFDMAYAHKLFQVFERLHSDEEFEGTGVGLGLALTNRIMVRHGGRIEAWGQVGEGAAFTLYFPKSPPAEIQ